MKICLSLLLASLLLACSSNTSNQLQVSPEHITFSENELTRHVEFLADDAQMGRSTNSKFIENSRNYIEQFLLANDISPLPNRTSHLLPFSYPYNLGERTGKNIAGFIAGETHKNKFLILTAHYDHLGTKGSKVFNGADDNASGVAALLEFAKRIKEQPLKHSVIILFTDSEEANLNGARAFVNQYANYVEQTKLNVNLDMLSGDKRTIRLHYVSHGLNSVLPLSKMSAFSRLQQIMPVTIKKGFKHERNAVGNNSRQWRLASDHGAFYLKKVPFIYFGVGTHKNYHTAEDNFANFNKRFFWLASNAIYQQLLYLDEHI